MTSELTSEAPRAETPVAPIDVDGGDRVARLHIRIALVFLAVGSLLLAFTAAELAFPDMGLSVAPLAYGRLFPAAVGLLVYGWLTVGLIGAGYYILPRVSGKPLHHPGYAQVGALLLVIGIVAGAVGVVLGQSEGRQYLEFPLWADAVLVLGLLLVVWVFTSTIAQNEKPLAPAEWFFGSAPVWLLLAHIVGNIPGLTGVNSVLQTASYRGSLFGLWFASAAVGIVYYLTSALTGRDPRRATQLTVAAFWSLAFVFALSSGSRLTYTAAPDWVETIGGVFSIGLFLPVAIVLVDAAAALRGRNIEANGATMKLVLAGGVAFAVLPVVNIALSARSSSAIVGMTEWVNGLDVLALLGVFSLWLFAFVHHTSLRRARGGGHYRISVLAVTVAVGTLLVSGVQAGLTWAAAANSGEVAAGDGFESTAGGLAGHYYVRFGAFTLFALAQLWLLFAAWRGRSVVEVAVEEEDEVDDELPAGVPVTLSKLRTGTLGIFAMVALFGFVFPAFEAEHTSATLLADEVRAYAEDDITAKGREVYLAEGCWYCHTQEVRGIVTDVGLGPVARAGDYADEVPSAAGVVRVGPDLMFVGSRDVTADWLRSYLQDPRSERSWSPMPAYGHLSSGDLDAIAAYVAGLKPFEFERE